MKRDWAAQKGALAHRAPLQAANGKAWFWPKIAAALVSKHHWLAIVRDSCDMVTAPFDRDLELGVADSNGVRAIPFPCRRVLGGWIKAETETRVAVRPTHWREWYTDESAACSPRDFARYRAA